MDFEQFPLARDLLYLATLFFGAGIGCILNRFRIKSTTRFRNISVTVGLCLFSVAFAALVASCIISNWMILKESSLFWPLGILAILALLAVRFPRAAGFPLLILAGILFVWIAYACLRFPAFDSAGEGHMVRDGSGLVLFRLIPPAGTDAEILFSFQAANDETILEFHALRISISREIPLIGGGLRGIIAEIMGGDELLYVDPRLNRAIFPFNYYRLDANRIVFMDRLMYYGEALGSLAVSELLPGVSRIIGVDSSGFSFH